MVKNDNINDNTKYLQMLSFFTVSNCYHFYVIIFPCTYFVLSFTLSVLGYYHLCYHMMLSFFTVIKCYNFCVIIFPCIIYVIIYCYHFPPFFFLLKTWHTPKENQTHGPFLTPILFFVRTPVYWFPLPTLDQESSVSYTYVGSKGCTVELAWWSPSSSWMQFVFSLHWWINWPKDLWGNVEK